jgi:hypothetical protein
LTPIRIDASQPYREPEPAHYDGGSAKSPSGGTLAVNSRYLLRDGRPWLPVMGEFHFTRYPESRWEEEILKMKASGVEIVATYVIWIHHEEIEGQFDWKGRRDLRTFGQLCAKHGMYLEARIGPWSHAEVRNGGFPDWLLKKGPTRVNDPVYLSYVRAWYGQIAQQLKGQLWKNGGPVIGIQLENEYSNRGPGAGDAHILELKRLALESGLDGGAGACGAPSLRRLSGRTVGRLADQAASRRSVRIPVPEPGRREHGGLGQHRGKQRAGFNADAAALPGRGNRCRHRGYLSPAAGYPSR